MLSIAPTVSLDCSFNSLVERGRIRVTTRMFWFCVLESSSLLDNVLVESSDNIDSDDASEISDKRGFRISSLERDAMVEEAFPVWK